MSGSARNLVIPLLAGDVLPPAACGSGAAAGNGAAKVDPVQSGELPGKHVHGVARDPGDDAVHLATHEGLLRYGNGAPLRVGPVVDLMRFSVTGPGHFYASEHPVIGLTCQHQ